MTVGEMEELLKGLPKDMDIIMETIDDMWGSVCIVNSEVITIGTPDGDESILLLMPCTCDDDFDETEYNGGIINSKPDLN